MISRGKLKSERVTPSHRYFHTGPPGEVRFHHLDAPAVPPRMKFVSPRVLLLAILVASPLLGQAPLNPQIGAGPERRLTDPTPGPWASVMNSALASNGDTMLAVWSDMRAGRPAVFAARITRQGEILDPDGILLAGESNQSVDVLWDGTRFLVSWIQGADRTVFLSAVTTDGVTTPPSPLVSNAYRPQFSRNGSRVLGVIPVASSPGLPSMRVGFLREDLTFETTAPLEQVTAPVVSAVGDGFVVAWMHQVGDRDFVVVQRIDERGLPVGPAFLVPEVSGVKHGFPLVIHAIGNEALVAAGDNERVVVVRVRADGTASRLVELNEPMFAYGPTELLLLEDGSFELLGETWSGEARTYRFSASGAFLLSSSLDKPAFIGGAVFSGGRVYATWHRDGSLYGKFAYFDEHPTRVSSAPSAQESVSVARSCAQTLATWHERRARQIVARIDDGPPIVIAVARQGLQTTLPVAIVDRKSWLIAWQETSAGRGHLFLRRLYHDGTLGEETHVASGVENQVTPVFATDGSRTVLLWPEAAGSEPKVRATWVGADLPADELPGIGQADAVWNGQRFLAVARASSNRIIGTFFDGPGQIGASFPISDPELLERDAEPAIAFSGERFLVTYIRFRDLFGRLLARDGTPFGPEFLIRRDAMGQFVIHPRVAWGGSAFFVAFNGTVIPVYADGGVAPAIELAAAGLRPSIVGLERGVLVGYSRAVPELHHVERGFIRHVGPVRTRTVRH